MTATGAAGQDRAVLLIHGQPGGARDWARVARELSDWADPIAVDRPGWDGHSEPLDLRGNAGAALDALDARGIDRAVVVGHSLGGAVAAWIAAVHPERVAALVLAAPAANVASIEPLDRWLAKPVAGYLASTASLTGLGLALAAGPVRRRIINGSELEENYLRAAGRALLTPWARRAYVSEQRWLLRDLPELDRRLSGIAAPTTILAGTADRIVPAAAPRALAAAIGDARLVALEGAGHLLPQLHPRRVAQAIALALPDAKTL